jgi:hypothetical protein
MEEKIITLTSKHNNHADKFEKQQKELDKITKIDLRNIQESIKKLEKNDVPRSDFDYLKDQFEHLKREVENLQKPVDNLQQPDKLQQEVPPRPTMQSQQSPLKSKYTVVLDGESTLSNGTKVRYRSPLMTKPQNCYIMETLDDHQGQRCYSALTNTNTKIIIYDKHIESIEQRPETELRHANVQQSSSYRNNEFDNHSYGSYQPPYMQRYDGQRRQQTYRETITF